MKSKWSKVIKSESRGLAVESFEMAELIPLLPRESSQRQSHKEEEEEHEPPHDCSALQQQAFEAGRETGKAEGIAECRQEAEREIQRAVELVKQIDEARVNILCQVESDLVKLALAIAKKVIHREVSLDKDVVIRQVQQILKDLSASSAVCLKVHPDELDHLQAMQSNFVTRDGESSTIRIEGDPTVSIGGCIIQTDGLYIDAAIEQQLNTIGQSLELQNTSHEPSVPASSD